MADVAVFTFNAFQENTVVVWDETRACTIFDPGCHDAAEKQILLNFILDHQLHVEKLINTHCHVDHVFGNKYVAETFNVGLEIHEGELPVLKAALQIANMYGFEMEESPEPSGYIKEGDIIEFGNTKLKALFTPGHSPASLSFYDEKSGFVVAGDVLFQGSIGRTDLPGGDFDTLISSIKNELLLLDEATIVYPGHGSQTTIGNEIRTNPFLVGG